MQDVAPSMNQQQLSHCSPNKVLARCASLLGFDIRNKRQAIKDQEVEESSAISECSLSGSALRSLFSKRGSISFPSLSLQSEPHHHNHHHLNTDRIKVEAMALFNLSKPILAENVTSAEHILPFKHSGQSDNINATVVSPCHKTDCNFGAQCLPVTSERNLEDVPDSQTVLEEKRNNKTDDKKSKDYKTAAQSNSVCNGFAIDSKEPSGRMPDESVFNDIAEVPFLMMTNMLSSFALLVDARLRAYSRFLAGHAMALTKNGIKITKEKYHDDSGVKSPSYHALSGIERKLQSLAEIGDNIQINMLSMSFQLHPQDDDPSRVHVKESSTIMRLTFKATIAVYIPNFFVPSKTEKITVLLQAPGKIVGRCIKCLDQFLLTSVRVQLDVHTLLAVMIDQACIAVLQAVNNVNTSVSDTYTIPFAIGDDPNQAKCRAFSPEATLFSPVDDAYQTKCRIFLPETLLFSPVDDEDPQHVVSPDLKSVGDSHLSPSHFELNQVHRTTDSIVQDYGSYAAIVDFAIGEIDLNEWAFAIHPCKKMKMTIHQGTEN